MSGKLTLKGSIWHFMDPETVKAHGPWVRHSDYAQLERDLAEARAEIERWAEQALKEEDCRKMWQAERDRLAAALREIMKDDQQPSHPCGPQQYGHFGNIARASLQTGEQGE